MIKFFFSSPYLNWKRGEKKYAIAQMAFTMTGVVIGVAYNYHRERQL